VGRTSSWILTGTESRCKFLVYAAFISDFQHSYPIVGSGILTDTDPVDTSTWREGVAALWNASVDDTAMTSFLTNNSQAYICALV
jgi:hypothetical protein